MNSNDSERNDRLSRRDLLKVSAAAGLGAGLAASTSKTSVAAKSNRIIDENQRAGTTDWQLTYTRVDPKTRYRSPLIEGYMSRASVAVGDSIEIMVSTNPAGPFEIDIYRMGYYGGTGARHMKHLGPFDGLVQSDPEIGEKRLRECRWESCATFEIPDDWVSGVYLGKLSLVEDRYQSYVIFIVTENRDSDLLFQCSDNTWQAYNRWPSQFALYDDGKSQWALKPDVQVSYDRPYGKYCQILDNPLSQGSGEFLLWEFPLAYWMEREGYDVTYCSNTDVHARPEILGRTRGFVSVGHDEYWSLEQFRNVKSAVDDGMNAAFLSGNSICFVSPFTPSSTGVPNRIIERAGRYGGLSDIEKETMGPFPITDAPNEATLMGARTTNPYNGSGDWIVNNASSWIFEGTGMKNGDRVPGLVGWEFHGEPADIPGLDIVAQGIATNAGNETAHWTATLYPGPKGNWVFNAATIWWSQALSVPPGHMPPISHYGRPHGPDSRVEQITHNVFRRFLG